MRVNPTAIVTITDGTDQRNVLFSPDETLATENLDGFREQRSGREVIAASGTFTVPLSDLNNPAGLFLRVEGGDVNVNLDGLGNIPLRRGAASSGAAAAPTPDNPGTAARLLLEAHLTSAVVTVLSADVVLFWAAWGDVDPSS